MTLKCTVGLVFIVNGAVKDVCIYVSVVVSLDAELDVSSVDDVNQCENTIVSQWTELSANEQNELRDRMDEIFRPLGLETRLVVLNRANGIALYFICKSLTTIVSLRVRWRNRQLRQIVQSLFTFLAGVIPKVRVKRLTWPLSDYERILGFCSSIQGKKITTIL